VFERAWNASVAVGKPGDHMIEFDVARLVRGYRHGGIILAATLVLAACGNAQQAATSGSPPEGAPVEQAAAAASDPQGPFFDPALTRPRCPARVDTARYPGADVVDVRLGMSRDEALAILHCERPAFSVRGGGSLLGSRFDRGELGPQSFTVLNGQRQPCDSMDAMMNVAGGGCRAGTFLFEGTTESIAVETPGMPGQQRVLAVWRRQLFEASRLPAVDDVVAGFVRKYGAATQRQNETWQTTLHWAWDSVGNPLTVVNPLFRECANNLNPVEGSSQRWSEGCGQTIAVQVTRSNDNPGLASEYHVALINQSAFYRAGETLDAQLAAQTEAGRQQEVERARSNNAAGDLDL
jgi:hypothetical protein